MDGPDRLVKGLLGQLLRHVGIVAQGEEKFVHRRGMAAVDFVQIFHGGSPSLLSIYPR